MSISCLLWWSSILPTKILFIVPPSCGRASGPDLLGRHWVMRSGCFFVVPEISFSCSPSRTLKRRDTSFLEENGTKQVDKWTLQKQSCSFWDTQEWTKTNTLRLLKSLAELWDGDSHEITKEIVLGSLHHSLIRLKLIGLCDPTWKKPSGFVCEPNCLACHFDEDWEEPPKKRWSLPLRWQIKYIPSGKLTLCYGCYGKSPC